MATDKKLTQRNNAWLLDFGSAGHGAVGTLVLLELIDAPNTFTLPNTPPYCRNVVFWREYMLPVMDMATRLGTTPHEQYLIAVVAYKRNAQDETRFGALKLASSPVGISVIQAPPHPLPQHPRGWKKLSLSCFEHEGNSIPILHLSNIFARIVR